MAPADQLPLDQAARLLGVSPAALREQPGLLIDQAISTAVFDALCTSPPPWLLRSRADALLREVVTTVEADLAAAAAARTAEVEATLTAATLTAAELAALLDLDEETVQALAPRRGWTAEAVATVLRTRPAWTASRAAARLEANRVAQRTRATESRRRAAASAKVAAAERNRARWAELAGVELDQVPPTMTKAPTAQAIARFRAKPPRWAAGATERA